MTLLRRKLAAREFPPLQLKLVSNGQSSFKVWWRDSTADDAWNPFLGEVVVGRSGTVYWQLHWDWDPDVMISGKANSTAAARKMIAEQFDEVAQEM